MDSERINDAASISELKRRSSPWSPKNWGLKRWAAAFLLVVVIIIAIVVPIEVKKNTAYPNYSKLTYALKDTYRGEDFFDMFDYGNGTDKNNGAVNYVDKAGAAYLDLTSATNTSAIIKVDTSYKNTTTRPSVKLISKNQYTKGLFIFDVLHTPYGCGTWPALWLTDPDNWPMNGEIDVMEAVNRADTGNQMTLHTTDGCTMRDKRKETGTVLTTNCLNTTDYNAGCGVRGNKTSFGEAFNEIGGGVYAMEWRTAGIRMWYFPRAYIPSDITNLSPDPSSWPTATSDFPSTNCDIDSHFKNNKIIVNIQLCGDWAGAESSYTTANQCPGTCTEYVSMTPTAFAEAYWEFKSFRVYTATDA